jgi:hypothetical protein
MSNKKKTEKIESEESTNTKNPLVFISHHADDEKIAEAFSSLLGSVSAGVLKSFRSSDKKGTQGIEYGVEWFSEIMRKLNESSAVICLLTKNSINKPWILYEAGVARGKLESSVLGVALGVKLSDVLNGPFAQFQNCSDDEDSLTKLVMQLVRTIPGADPDEKVIREQVKQFIKTLNSILKNKTENIVEKEKKDDASSAKIFEEIKIMFQDLPSKINKDVDFVNRKKRRLPPFVMDEIAHIGMEVDNPLIGFLVMISFLKEDFPWLYEIGLDTYREIKQAKNGSEKRKIIKTFEQAVDLLNHPVMREFSVRSEESYLFYKELRHFLRHYLDRLLNQF